MANQWRKYQNSQALITVIISLLTSLVMSVVVLLLFYTHQPAESQVASSLFSQLAGTWKIESITPEPVTMIVSAEGKFTLINPNNPKEAAELVSITKLSDSTQVPEGTTVQTIAIQQRNQTHKAQQSEGKNFVNSLNRGQQGHFVEKSKWGNSIESLGISLPSETKSYRYRTEVVKSIQTVDNDILKAQKIAPSLGIAVQTAIAKKENLKSYLGVVYLRPVKSNPPTVPPDVTSFTILCESNQPTMKAPDLPKFDGERMLCPAGYTDVYR